MRKLIVFILKKILGDYYYDFYYWNFFFRITPAPPANGKKNLLIINHVFEQDIEALKLANHDFNLITISAFVLRNVGTQIFPPEVESYQFFNKPSLQPVKDRYKKIIKRFVNQLIKKYQPVTVVSPSDNFFYIRQLVEELKTRNIPFIVIDKEGTICPAYFTHFAAYIKDNCPLIAHHILVWSERQRDFWQKTGVPTEKIKVVGQPRSDFWKQPSRWLSKEKLGVAGLRKNSKMVLFFTYDPWAYTPDYMVEKGEMHWDILRRETHDVLFDFAKTHPEIDLVIKAHPQQLDLLDIKKEINKHKIVNVFLASGPELSNHLIVNADCIIGFQSTALIEAMMTEKPIIYTFWGEAREKWSEDLIPFHKTKGVCVAHSSQELTGLLEKLISDPILSLESKKARENYTAEYFYQVDGQAAARTLKEINKIIS